MSNEVAVLETREVAISGEQKDLIKKTICKDATDAEMQLFFFDCQRRGVHPLDKLIHFTKRAGKYTPITSIDFFRQRAHASGVYAGEEVPTYELLSSGAPDACTYTVYRIVQGVRCPWTAKARWDEYYPGEQLGFMWKKMPFLMLAKCAEALALRKAFPAELQGLYVKEEMEQAGTVEHKPLPKGAEMLAKIEEQEMSGGAAPTNKGVSEKPGSTPDFAPPSPDDPSEPWKAKVRTAHDSASVNKIYKECPEELRQDLYATYSAKLKELKGK